MSTRDSRHTSLIPSPTSPVAPCDLSDQPSATEYIGPSNKIGASWDLDHCNITPTKRGETSADIEIGANALLDAAEMSGAFNNVLDEMADVQFNNQQSIQDQLVGLNLSDWSSDMSRASPEPPVCTTHPAELELATPPGSEALVSAPTAEDIIPSPTDEELVSAPKDESISVALLSPTNDNPLPAPNMETRSENIGQISTPPRKQMSPFGGNIPPELATLRATPNATPVKRRLTFLPNVSNKKKKFPSVVGRLFGARERRNSTCTPRLPSRTRKRLNSAPVLGQRTINEMIGSAPREKKLDESLSEFVAGRAVAMRDEMNEKEK